MKNRWAEYYIPSVDLRPPMSWRPEAASFHRLIVAMLLWLTVYIGLVLMYIRRHHQAEWNKRLLMLMTLNYSLAVLDFQSQIYGAEISWVRFLSIEWVNQTGVIWRFCSICNRFVRTTWAWAINMKLLSKSFHNFASFLQYERANKRVDERTRQTDF